MSATAGWRRIALEVVLADAEPASALLAEVTRSAAVVEQRAGAKKVVAQVYVREPLAPAAVGAVRSRLRIETI